MRTLILLTVLLGVALAKPNDVQLKKLARLLKSVLEKKDDGPDGQGSGSGSGGYAWPPPGASIESTLFEGLGDEIPFKLFGGLIDKVDFSEPLEITPGIIDENMDQLKKVADAISRIAKKIGDELRDFADANSPQDLSIDGIAQFTAENLLPLFSDPEADLEPHMIGSMVALLRGAVAGTQGAERDEPGCDFDGEEDELVECVMNKMFLVTYASDRTIEMAQMMLEVDIDGSGKVLRMCDQLHQWFENSAGKAKDPAELLTAFKGTMRCLGENVELIRDRIGLRAAEAFPGEGPSSLPLPTLIRIQAFLQHMGAQSYWAFVSVLEAMWSPEHQRDLKGLAAKKTVLKNRFLSHTAKAFARSKIH